MLIDRIKFYTFKNYGNYLFSRCGKVYNIHSKQFLTGSKNPAGYHNFRLTRDDGNVLTWGRHRLLTIIFKCPKGLTEEEIKKRVANHINGIKGDDRLDNLELITAKENVEHAGAMKLTSKCKPVSIRCYITGNVLDFPSIIECARNLKLTKDTVLYRCRAGEERVFPDMRQYRFGRSDTEWIIPDSIEEALSKNGTSNAVVGKNLITGEVKNWISISQYAKDHDVSVASITQLFKDRSQPMTRQYWLLKKKEDLNEWRDIDCRFTEYSNTFKTRIVMASNKARHIVYSSAVDCAEAFNISKTTLNERIKACTLRGSVFDGWIFLRY